MDDRAVLGTLDNLLLVDSFASDSELVKHVGDVLLDDAI